MRWEISNAKGSGTGFIGYAETTPVSEAVSELWRKYLDDAEPRNTNMAWDYLGVYIYLDSGRVILFPSLQASRYRDAEAKCQIICPDLLNFYDTLIEANLPDEQLEPQLIRKENEVLGLLSTSARNAHLPERLGRPAVKILYYRAGAQKPMKEEILRAG